MKLTDLNPRWVTFLSHPADGIIPPRSGVSFDCPHCRAQRLVVKFLPILDPQNILSLIDAPPMEGNEWKREGDTFETLTLSPSVDASFHGHWHGFIENGEIR
jgi:uncharacterized protein DUF6527